MLAHLWRTAAGSESKKTGFVLVGRLAQQVPLVRLERLSLLRVRGRAAEGMRLELTGRKLSATPSASTTWTTAAACPRPRSAERETHWPGAAVAAPG